MTTRVVAAASIVLISLSLSQAAHAQGIWVDSARIASLPVSGAAWNNLLSHAQAACGTPNLANQDDSANVCVMAKALVYARTGDSYYRVQVVNALWSIVNSGTYSGRALALGRELAAYVISADLIDLRGYDGGLDNLFRSKISELLTTPTTDGPRNLIDCQEARPNNWGTHCGASRAAVAAYLGDYGQLARVAQVFKGWLGDRSSYAGFRYGDLSWQCNPGAPVGINPAGCTIGGLSVDGVLPDDQRRSGGFSWPPPKENYDYEALQGAMAEAVILERAGYDVFNWEDRALLRAFVWLQTQANFLAEGDDTWMPHLVNFFYAGQILLPAPVPARAGKNVGWTDWTHGERASAPVAVAAGSFTAVEDSFVRGGTYGSTNFGGATTLEVKDSTSTSTEYHRHIFMKFNIGGGGSVSTATLRLYVNSLANGSPVPVCVFAVPSDSWSENSLTWGNQPGTSYALSCQSITATGWVNFDVSSWVQGEVSGDGVVSLMLEDTSQVNRIAKIDSRENGHPPVIEVN